MTTMVDAINRQVTRLAISRWVLVLIAAVLLVVAGQILSEFQKILLSQMLIAGLFAMSLNLIMGYGGMVTFGHAAFYGLGAYTVAILITRYNIPAFVAFAFAPVVSALIAAVVGWFSVRRVQLYFSILTLAFGQLLYVIVFQSYGFTGGDNGIHGIRIPAMLLNATSLYYFILAVFAVCLAALYILVKSPFVLTLRAIRENAERARFVGVNVRMHQLLAFVLGAFFAGIAGGAMTFLNRFVGPDMLFWTTGAEPILASLLGGMFTLIGPALGAALLTFLHVTLTRYTEYWPTVLGTLTIIAVLFAPTGLVGLFDFRRGKGKS